MSSRTIIVLACLLLVGGFLAGRYSVPESMQLETRSVEADQKTENEVRLESVTIDQDRHREVMVTELVKPDGTRETTTRTVTDSQAKHIASSVQENVRTETASKDSTVIKTVQARSSLELSLLVGAAVSLSSGVGPLIYGLHVSRPLLGPIVMGLWGASNGVAGVSIGLRL